MKYNILSVVIVPLVLFSFCGNNTGAKNSGNNVAVSINDTGKLKIIPKPVLFDSVRKQLSLEYMYLHYGTTTGKPIIQPVMIVIHHTAIDRFDSSYGRMYGTILPDVRKEIRKAGMLNVSAHYLVDQDGTVYQLLPDTIFARHTIGLNPIAIGIENVGGDKLPLTEAQLNANEKLVRQLKQEHPAIEWVIGHKEYGNFRNTKLWMEKDDQYFTVKNDPAEDFLDKLRERLKDLQLKRGPEK